MAGSVLLAAVIGASGLKGAVKAKIFTASPEDLPMMGAGAGSGTAAAATMGQASGSEVKSKCAEFAMELEGMPKLPGAVVVETAGARPAAPPGAPLPETIVPCLYSN